MATISRRKIYDIPEEVGMDIVEAIDMLEIITLKGKSSAFSDKIYFEIMKICFFFTSMVFFSTDKKISKIKRPKIQKKNFQEKKLPEKFKVPKLVIQKLNEEFLQELRNEIRNTPDFSSVPLSNYLRGASRSRNVLLQENILCSIFG